MNLKLREDIVNFKPESYVNENNSENSGNNYLDCSLGVNPFGHSQRADIILHSAGFSSISCYPPFPYTELKKNIIEDWSDCCSLEAGNITFGAGSMDVLRNINRVFIKKDSSVLGSAPTFTSYPSDVMLCGGKFHAVPLAGNPAFKFHSKKFLQQINNELTMVYIDNPNNPTGQIISLEDIREIVKKAMDNDVCVLVDEAYGDFMSKENSAMNLIGSYENLIVTRTFSKGYGLAGLRIGYAAAGSFISQILSRTNIPFSICSPGCAAASAALKDKRFILDSRAKIMAVKSLLMSSLRKFSVLETSPEVPIMTLQAENPQLDLYNLFKSKGVLTESGLDFQGLGRNFVRLRVPKAPEALIKIIEDI